MMMHQQVGNRRGANSYAPPFLPMLHYQPQVLPLSGYNYQPYVGGYHPFVHQTTPQPPYYATTFYNPVEPDYFGAFGTCPSVEPQFSCHAPSIMPNMGSHSLNSRDAVASLRGDIMKQIEYYFSDENLNKPDRYLISLMDDKGWVPVPIIAGFHRVKAMCKSVTFILESLLDSSIVEVRGNRIRRRDVWSKYVDFIS
ncbi:la-related protein 1A-like [Rosa rugosa]|uniref:la-related protein 1A-like n=1 Tax=Rosa rugosa TaxID=74645 RepID=UPI002B410976|nr:la-related protein 1A-like [Rosa rugosa]